MQPENKHMIAALEAARKAGARGEIPVGAVLVNALTGEAVAVSGNLTEERHDPTAHAEMLVIQQGAKIFGTPRLVDCDLYVTLEPCPMCAAAIGFARIRRVYFGAYDPKGGGIDHGPRIYSHPTCHHKPEVYGGIEESAASALLKEFFKDKR